jgi:hypothetical protein
VWSASRPGRLYSRERPGTHWKGGLLGPGAGLDRCGKSRPTGIRSPDLPARSESLYRLSYPGSTVAWTFNKMLDIYPTRSEEAATTALSEKNRIDVLRNHFLVRTYFNYVLLTARSPKVFKLKQVLVTEELVEINHIDFWPALSRCRSAEVGSCLPQFTDSPSVPSSRWAPRQKSEISLHSIPSTQRSDLRRHKRLIALPSDLYPGLQNGKFCTHFSLFPSSYYLP